MLGLSAESEASFIVAVTMAVLAGLAVALRLLTKTWTKAGYAVDDWWLLFSLLTMYAYVGLIEGGGGLDITTLIFDYQKLVHVLKALYIIVPVYVLCVTAIKISILCLYRRLFPIQAFRRMSYVVDVLCVLWLIAAELASLLACIPARKFWDPLSSGRCLNFNTYFLGIEVANTIIDVIILCLPLHMIRNLHLPFRQKIALSMIFLVGAFVIVTCIVRIVLVYQPHSAYISFSKGQIWSSIQLGVALICACLPTYRPLLIRFKGVFSSLRQRYGSVFSRSSRSGSGSGSGNSDNSRGKSDPERDAGSFQLSPSPKALYGDDSRPSQHNGVDGGVGGLVHKTRSEEEEEQEPELELELEQERRYGLSKPMFVVERTEQVV
ncbi:MAG: hypothetical protein M1816_001860 [Peltula sp. TS41687]|nr:MAG: hypothetical protein M1816_001860 [Peltula sp. TS41687]